MSWFKIDDKMHEDDKQNEAGITAVGLWTMCGSWAADNWSDGFVPRRVAARFIPRGMKLETVAARLVDAGMWEPADDGWIIINFLKYNKSRAQRDADREAAVERMRTRREGDRKGAKPPVEAPVITSAEPPASPELPVCFPSASPERPPSIRKKKAKPQVSDDRSRELPLIPYPYPKNSPTESSNTPVPLTRNGRTIIASWIDACAVSPDQKLIGRMAGEVGQLLEGHAWEVVNQALADWHRFGYIDPAKLKLIVHRLENPRDPLVAVNGGMSTADQRVAVGAALIDKYERESLEQREILG